MHPILHQWPRLRLFLLVWLPVGALIGTGPFLAVGGTLDLELALVQDNHYGVSDSSLKFSFGLTIYF